MEKILRNPTDIDWVLFGERLYLINSYESVNNIIHNYQSRMIHFETMYMVLKRETPSLNVRHQIHLID